MAPIIYRYCYTSLYFYVSNSAFLHSTLLLAFYIDVVLTLSTRSNETSKLREHFFKSRYWRKIGIYKITDLHVVCTYAWNNSFCMYGAHVRPRTIFFRNEQTHYKNIENMRAFALITMWILVHIPATKMTNSRKFSKQFLDTLINRSTCANVCLFWTKILAMKNTGLNHMAVDMFRSEVTWYCIRHNNYKVNNMSDLNQNIIARYSGSSRALCHLKSAETRLFVRQLVQTNTKDTIKALHHLLRGLHRSVGKWSESILSAIMAKYHDEAIISPLSCSKISLIDGEVTMIILWVSTQAFVGNPVTLASNVCQMLSFSSELIWNTVPSMQLICWVFCGRVPLFVRQYVLRNTFYNP